jgi:hypothetical protein
MAGGGEHTLVTGTLQIHSTALSGKERNVLVPQERGVREDPERLQTGKVKTAKPVKQGEDAESRTNGR